MSNENKKAQSEHKPEEQPTLPIAQVELSDEELKQVVGGINIRKSGGDNDPSIIAI
ncbi:MAG TPA: bacteriocin [Ktedonobacterales bacterium]|jgi:bacteriocin-like protein